MKLIQRLMLSVLLLGAAAAQGARTVMVETNAAGDWVVVWPTAFWQTEGDERMHAIAEGTFDTMMPDYLYAYYTASQVDSLFRRNNSFIDAANILVDRDGLTNSVGYNLQDLMRWFDAAAGKTPTGTSTTVINNITISTSAVPTTAAAVSVAFAPQNYSPSASNVEQHLVAIDSRLAYLSQLIAGNTNYVPPGTTGSLDHVTITGANLAYEGTTEAYTLTATYSDATTSNVTAQATWGCSGAVPAGTVMAENDLQVGSLRGDALATILAQYTYRGVARSDTHLVTLSDTNPPVLARIDITGTNRLDEGGSATYRAYAIYSDSVTNEVTDTAAWSVAGSPPAGTSVSGNVLTAGSVSADTAIALNAAFAAGSIIGTGTQTVTIANTDQDITLALTYSGVYATGTLHVEAYSTASMQNWPLWSTTKAGVSLIGGTNIVVRFPTPYSGQTWWFAWLDTDGNSILNGITGAIASPPMLRIDEPAAIATGQSASTGIALLPNHAETVSFAMADTRSGYHRQGWSAADCGGAARKLVIIRNMSYTGGPVVFYQTITNRTYICDQDWLNRGATAPVNNGYQLFLYGVNAAGTIDGNTAKSGSYVHP